MVYYKETKKIGLYKRRHTKPKKNTATNQVKLSMLFKWYAEDFGNNREEILAWILDHLADPDKKQALKDVGEGPNVSYITYDWGNNAKE